MQRSIVGTVAHDEIAPCSRASDRHDLPATDRETCATAAMRDSDCGRGGFPINRSVRTDSVTQHFDTLTKQLNETQSRRSVLARIFGALVIAITALFLGQASHAKAARGITPACARLGQPVSGTICCQDLAADTDGICRVPVGGNCREDDDCVGAALCVHKTHGLGAICTGPS